MNKDRQKQKQGQKKQKPPRPKFEPKERFDQAHVPKNISLEALLKPRQIVTNTDADATDYVESMYSTTKFSDFAQLVLKKMEERPVVRPYVHAKWQYRTGFEQSRYVGSVDMPTVAPTTTDYHVKDADEIKVLQSVIRLLRKPDPVPVTKKVASCARDTSLFI